MTLAATVAAIATPIVCLVAVLAYMINENGNTRYAQRAATKYYVDFCRGVANERDVAKLKLEGLTPQTFDYCMRWGTAIVDPGVQVDIQKLHSVSQRKRRPF